jgi:hypothetical protein
MKKTLQFTTSSRVTFKNQFIGWINSDPSVNLKKDVKTVSADQGESVNDLLLGNAEDIDLDAPTKRFWLSSKKTPKTDAVFLGYLETKSFAKAEVLQNLWDQFEIRHHER